MAAGCCPRPFPLHPHIPEHQRAQHGGDRVRTSKAAISEDQEEPTIGVALAAAGRFGLKPDEAKRILREVFTAVSGWRKTGRQLRLSAATLDAYASAFEQPLMTEAARLPAE